ncbi:DUF6042 family protein [Streptomyces sp. DSM 41527]|uniref:DUF6042 family protein n=1 Tax=Streptomyces mooreae TaxID=3075523 RepID=A0ABU2TIE3_9ACTN|nr:DUF6042 family protein [Streptomyces sp. DSM 41527]MDT0460692.1 DUF6042 family protein [Streptomyces sp. DSM 41527]
MHTDFWSSGWAHVLPQHAAMMLCMVFGTAATRGLEGNLDEITREILGEELPGVFGNLGKNLSSPILWRDQEEIDDAESDEEREEIRTAAQAKEASLANALRAAGMSVPTTIRELGDTMVQLGIATTDNGSWDMPDPLPRPEEVLTLPDDVLARLKRLRQFEYTESADQAIVKHLVDDLDYPDELFTSVDRLVDITGEDIDQVRAALDHLVELGDVQLYRGEPRTVAVAKDLPAHARFYLVPDWDNFNEHRMTIRRGS